MRNTRRTASVFRPDITLIGDERTCRYTKAAPAATRKSHRNDNEVFPSDTMELRCPSSRMSFSEELAYGDRDG